MKEATGRIQASKRVFQCLKMNCAVQWHSPNFLRQSWILHVFKKFFKWLFKAEISQKQSNTNFPPIFTQSLENWLYLLCLCKQYFRWFCRWKGRRNENAFYLEWTLIHIYQDMIPYTGVSSLGVSGVPWHTQILVDQLTLFQPGGTDYAHLITRCGQVVRDFESEAKTRCNFLLR